MNNHVSDGCAAWRPKDFLALFILKINSIADVISSSLEKYLYVDDFSVSCSSRNMALVERQL